MILGWMRELVLILANENAVYVIIRFHKYFYTVEVILDVSAFVLLLSQPRNKIFNSFTALCAKIILRIIQDCAYVSDPPH